MNESGETGLVEGLKRKDAAVFDQLMARHGAMMYRVASRIVGQKEEAEEVLQESLLSVFEKIHTFDGKSALSTWLYRVVVNAALMRLRARSRLREESLDLRGPEFNEHGMMDQDVGDWSSAEESVLRQETREVLHREIEKLPETYRVVYVLAEIEGLAHQEIGGILELTVGAVKVRLHRARLFLREALEEYFVERKEACRG